MDMAKLRRPCRTATFAAALLAVTAVPGGALALSSHADRVGGVVTTFRLGGAPDRVAVDTDSAWVGDSGALSRVDTSTGQVVHIPEATTPVAVDAHGVWARLRDRFDTIARIDPVTHLVVSTFTIGGSPAAIASTPGAVWVADSTGTVTRLDPETNSVTATIPLGQIGFGVAARSDAVWVTGRTRSTVGAPLSPGDALRPDDSRAVLWRIDPATNRVVSTIDTPGNCGAVATAAATTWVECFTVRRIDEASGRLVDTTAEGPAGLAVGEGAVWALATDGTVRRVDPTTDRVTGSLHLAAGSEGIAAGGGSVWVPDPHLHDPATVNGSGTVTRVRLAGSAR